MVQEEPGCKGDVAASDRRKITLCALIARTPMNGHGTHAYIHTSIHTYIYIYTYVYIYIYL